MGRTPTRRSNGGKTGATKPARVSKPVVSGPAVEAKQDKAPAPKVAVAKPVEAPKAPLPAAVVKPASRPVSEAAPATSIVPAKSPVAKPASPAPSPVPAAPVIKMAAPVASPAPSDTPAPAAPLAQPPKATVEKVAEATQESVKMVDTTTQKAKTALNDATEQARAALEKGTKVIEEFNDFAKGNVEAFVAAGRAAAKGAETLGQNAAEFSRKSFEEATKALKTISAAKSPAEFFKYQNDFAKSQFDAVIAEASKVSEAVVKIFGDVAEPISSRAAVAADKFKSAIK